MLEIRTRRIRSMAIVDAIGRIGVEEVASLDQSGATLRAVVRELLEHGEKQVLLNFTGVSFIDSSGIGELFSILVSAQRRGAEIKLVNPGKIVREALYTVQLHRFLEITSDWAEALRSARPAAAA